MSVSVLFTALAVLYGAYSVTSASLAAFVGYGAAFLVFAIIAGASWTGAMARDES